MATNHMEEVAKILGVELDEEFEIVFPQPSDCKAIARLTQSGVNVVEANVYDAYNFKAYLLRDLLVGSYTIKRKPWKPENGEYYFYVNANGDECRLQYEDGWIHMSDAMRHIYNYKLGNCYRTIEEAKANKDKWIAFYNSDDVLEV